MDPTTVAYFVYIFLYIFFLKSLKSSINGVNTIKVEHLSDNFIENACTVKIHVYTCMYMYFHACTRTYMKFQ